MRAQFLALHFADVAVLLLELLVLALLLGHLAMDGIDLLLDIVPLVTSICLASD